MPADAIAVSASRLDALSSRFLRADARSYTLPSLRDSQPCNLKTQTHGRNPQRPDRSCDRQQDFADRIVLQRLDQIGRDEVGSIVAAQADGSVVGIVVEQRQPVVVSDFTKQVRLASASLHEIRVVGHAP